jgi:hypothetical protein
MTQFSRKLTFSPPPVVPEDDDDSGLLPHPATAVTDTASAAQQPISAMRRMR